MIIYTYIYIYHLELACFSYALRSGFSRGSKKSRARGSIRMETMKTELMPPEFPRARKIDLSEVSVTMNEQENR